MKILFYLAYIAPLAAALVKVPNDGTMCDLREHPGHYPFISYLTFRNECNHRIDQSHDWFDTEKVQQGDLIYVNGWYLDWFFHNVHDLIEVPYLLVVADIGGWFPEPRHQRFLYDPKLAAWFCRNMVFSSHPKLFQIPMGQDVGLFHYERIFYDWLISAVVHKDLYPKRHLLYMCFYPRPHGDRDKIEKMFWKEPYCYSINNPETGFTQLSPTQFYIDAASSYFTLSPLGLETDCVRTWEALVLGSIPIVEHTFLDPLYEGLPVLIVHDWNEINAEFLQKKQEELKPLSLEKAYFDYWRDLLKKTQEKVRNNDLSFCQLDATRWKSEDLQTLTQLLCNKKSLHYKGFLSTVRPFELASAVPHLEIGLSDPWLDEATFNDLLVHYPAQNISFAGRGGEAIFLDLTYYRTSLQIDFSTSIVTKGNFRHSLKKDLQELYTELPFGTLLCGNQVNDSYVREVLDAFANENHLPFKKNGSFWFVTKEKQCVKLEEFLPDPHPEIYSRMALLPNSLEQREFSLEIPLQKTIVEVGADTGDTTCLLTKYLTDAGRLFAISDWSEPLQFQQFLSNITHHQLTQKVIPVRMNYLKASLEFNFLDFSIDLIYMHQPVYDSLKAWYPHIKLNGILCGDGWNSSEVQRDILKFAQEKKLLLFNTEDFWVFF